MAPTPLDLVDQAQNNLATAQANFLLAAPGYDAYVAAERNLLAAQTNLGLALAAYVKSQVAGT